MQTQHPKKNHKNPLLKQLSILLLILQINLSFQKDISFITCTKEGDCNRADNIKLEIGNIPRVPSKNNTDSFSITSKKIISFRPFYIQNSSDFLIGSSQFTCADGVFECINSCCNNGQCTDPSNICSVTLKNSSSTIYASLIVFVCITIMYWIFFGYIGAKYSKRKGLIRVNDKDDCEVNSNSNSNNQREDLIKSRPGLGLDNFDDDFTYRYQSNIKDYKQEMSAIGDVYGKTKNEGKEKEKFETLSDNHNKKENDKKSIISGGFDPHLLGVPKMKRNLKKENCFEEGKNEKNEKKIVNELLYKSKPSSPKKKDEENDEFEIKEL